MDEFIQLVKTEPAKKKRGRPRKVQATGEGLGDILSSVKKTAQKVARNVGSKILGKKLAEKVERYGDAVLFLNKLPLSPAVKEILRKHGDEPILKMVACRTPVRKVLNGLMNAVSLGSFNKKFSRLPYDDLFHLSLWITTASGTYSVEKEEVIKIKSNPRTEEHAEFNEISPVPSALTMNKLMMGGEKILGDRFTRYDASSNNCQDFIIALLDGSNVGSAADKAFIKQNTDSLFKDDSFLRRFARKLTNLGASVSTAITGVDDTPVASTKTASQFEIPSHADTSVSDGVEGAGRKRKIPKKAQKGQRTIPEMTAAREALTAAQEANAVRLAREFTDPSAPPSLMSRVHELIARRQRGELDSNFNELRTPTEPPTPESSQGAGMVKRGRGRPRKLVGGVHISRDAFSMNFDVMSDEKKDDLKAMGITPAKLANLKKETLEYIYRLPYTKQNERLYSSPRTDTLFNVVARLWSEY